MKQDSAQPMSQERHVSCRILRNPICYSPNILRWCILPAQNRAAYYGRSYVRGNCWTGSFMDSSTYDLIYLHWFYWDILLLKISFRSEVETSGVIATSVLTFAKCQCHTSSVWPWSGVPKVHLYNTFLGSLRQRHGVAKIDSSIEHQARVMRSRVPCLSSYICKIP